MYRASTVNDIYYKGYCVREIAVSADIRAAGSVASMVDSTVILRIMEVMETVSLPVMAKAPLWYLCILYKIFISCSGTAANVEQILMAYDWPGNVRKECY